MSPSVCLGAVLKIKVAFPAKNGIPVTVCSLLVSHCTNCTSLAYLAVLSVGGHITGLACIPYYLLYEVPAKRFWTDHVEC
jgi:hypothetical protein